MLLLLPVIATICFTYDFYGELTPDHLLITHMARPLLWVLDVIFVSYSLLIYVSVKISDSKKRLNTHTLIVYRQIGLLWGLLIYLVAGASIIHYDHGRITAALFQEYQLGHPVFLSLLGAIPFFFFLGYMAEKIFLAREENRAISAEMARQNVQLQQEILERKVREAQLIEAKKEAQMGVKVKDQFLSNMSHEIRTPMNGVIGLTNLLLDTELNDEQQQFAQSISHSAKNLLVLINQILDLSKINSEKLTLEYIDFDIREYVRNVEDNFRSIANEKGIILRTVIDHQVPLVVCGDPVRFNQILLNLVGNAIKFTEEGGVDVIIQSTKADDGPRLTVHVNDTGIGIPPDKLPVIFESFTQAGNETTRKYGGTGLGLAISKELVELYGGKLTVESEVGKGSSFMFQLQLRSAQHKTISIQSEKLPWFKNPEKIKILVAEDDMINQMVIRKTLAAKGFQVTLVPNGQEVIESIYKETFDVILMDVNMPVMGGLDATRFIRNATEAPLCDIKIIAMTASAMKDEVERCLAVGMDDHVAKPFKTSELLEKLSLHLHNAFPASRESAGG